MMLETHYEVRLEHLVDRFLCPVYLNKASHLNLGEDLWATDVYECQKQYKYEEVQSFIRNMSLMTPPHEEIANYLTSSLQFVMFSKELFKNVKPALL